MFEPKIVGFLCTWCSYTGADSAGIARMKYPANLRAVRVPCSGRVSPELIMRAFDQGADGVLVLGCHIGECHYDSGNHRTAKRMPALHTLLTFSGLEPERLRLDWVSASEGERFSRIVSEFTESVRALGPARWRVSHEQYQVGSNRLSAPIQKSRTDDLFQLPTDYYQLLTVAIQDKARQLLESQQVACVIGYETGRRGQTRPAFVYSPEDVDRLIWNQDCTHNLTTYLREKLHSHKPGAEPPPPVAVVCKPCDSRAVNMLLAENQFTREQVHVIGVVCPGVEERSKQPPVFSFQSNVNQTIPVKRSSDSNEDSLLNNEHGTLSTRSLQARCRSCDQRIPFVYDTLVGDATLAPQPRESSVSGFPLEAIAQLRQALPQERMEFWLSQFDRCLRCYACRQACPMCNCPTCLYERDDSLWVGMDININEKRAFHLGRAYHLAGRCIGCDECERVCPVGIPISLLNRMLADEMAASFDHHAGYTIAPSPFITILGGEEG